MASPGTPGENASMIVAVWGRAGSRCAVGADRVRHATLRERGGGEIVARASVRTA